MAECEQFIKVSLTVLVGVYNKVGKNVNLQDYDLPIELSEFTKVTKDVNAKDDYRFKSLFMALDGSKEIAMLRSVLNYLKDKQYKCDIAELQKLFG